MLDNYSPHLSTKKDTLVGHWAAANNVEFASTPTNSSWLNRIEAQFTALRDFTLDGTDHASHRQQGSMIRRYIIWRPPLVELSPPELAALHLPSLSGPSPSIGTPAQRRRANAHPPPRPDPADRGSALPFLGHVAPGPPPTTPFRSAYRGTARNHASRSPGSGPRRCSVGGSSPVWGA